MSIVILSLLILLIAGALALSVWSAKRQQARIADAVEDWCKDVVENLEKRRSQG